MTRNRRTTTTLAVTAALALGLAGAASAGVIVYDNDFSSRSEVRELAKSGGKRCARGHRKKGKAMVAKVKRGPTTCSFRVPVQGDGELPDHDARVDGKVLKRTPKQVRGASLLEVSVRAGGGGVGYTLRVFPKKRRFELVRGPEGGGQDFPARGKHQRIKPVNKRNRLRLVAAGATVRAFVNGTQVARATDENPGQVSGRKIRFGVGNRKSSAKPVSAAFKRVSVGIPGV